VPVAARWAVGAQGINWRDAALCRTSILRDIFALGALPLCRGFDYGCRCLGA